MARREDLTPEQLKLQQAYDRSWAAQRRMLADPDTLAFLKDCFRRLDERPAAPRMTGAEFLAMTAEPAERMGRADRSGVDADPDQLDGAIVDEEAHDGNSTDQDTGAEKYAGGGNAGQGLG